MFFVVLVVVVSIAVYSLSYFKFSRELISLNNQVSSLSVEFVDKKALIDWAKRKRVIDGQKVKQIHLIVSDRELADPTFVQKDSVENVVIASSINITDQGIAEIEISLGEHILSEDPTKDKSRWLDSEYIQIANQLAKWNLAAKGKTGEYREIEPFSVFRVREL